MESETIFDRTGGDRFDYSQGICVLCGITREEFKDNDYPECTGSHTESESVRQILRVVILRKPHRQLSARDHLLARPVLQLGRVPCLLQ
jgi:hypothetical protein